MGGTLGGPGQPEGPWSPPGQVTWGGPGGPPPAPGQNLQPGSPPPSLFTPPRQAPPSGPPPFGPPQPGGPPATNRTPLLIGIAALVVLALLGGLLVMVLRGEEERHPRFDDSRSREAAAASKKVMAAASSMAQSSAIGYSGSFRDDTGDTVDVEAQLTNQGWTQATVTRDGDTVKVLTNGSHSYLKAGESYWSRHGAPRDSLDDYTKRWVRVPTDELGIDLARSLSPAVLGADLLLAVERDELVPGPVSTLNGVEAQEVATRYATVYVTTAEPHRVVRIASRTPASPGPGGTGGGEVVAAAGGSLVAARTPIGPDEFEFDLSDLSTDQVRTLFTRLEKQIRELKDSVDSEVRFALDGQIKLDPCTVSACTATVSMSNQVSSTSPYLMVSRPVVATFTIRMTLDKRPVKTCRTTRRMKPNGATTVRCRAGYTVPADGRTHHIEAVARAVARATVDADIKKLVRDLLAEQKAGAPKPPQDSPDLGVRWKPCDPSEISRKQDACNTEARRIPELVGGGELYTIGLPAGADAMGSYRGYDTDWTEHVVVVKAGRVYDPWTSRYGEPIPVYKSRWEYGDLLDFGF